MPGAEEIRECDPFHGSHRVSQKGRRVPDEPPVEAAFDHAAQAGVECPLGGVGSGEVKMVKLVAR